MRFWFSRNPGDLPGFLRAISTLSLSALLAYTVSACSDETGGSGGADEPGGACNVQPKTVTGLATTHLAACSEVDYPDQPPAGGQHYSVWAAFQSYAFPVPRGFWVHDLEHGAVVYSYNCADSAGSSDSSDSSDGCAEEVAEVQAMIDALPPDPLCASPTPRRVLLTPDPLLDVRWGVSAWGFTLRADCVDITRFRQFYLNHFGRGPEDLCAAGTDFAGTRPCE